MSKPGPKTRQSSGIFRQSKGFYLCCKLAANHGAEDSIEKVITRAAKCIDELCINGADTIILVMECCDEIGENDIRKIFRHIDRGWKLLRIPYIEYPQPQIRDFVLRRGQCVYLKLRIYANCPNVDPNDYPQLILQKAANYKKDRNKHFSEIGEFYNIDQIKDKVKARQDLEKCIAEYDGNKSIKDKELILLVQHGPDFNHEAFDSFAKKIQQKYNYLQINVALSRENENCFSVCRLFAHTNVVSEQSKNNKCLDEKDCKEAHVIDQYESKFPNAKDEKRIISARSLSNKQCDSYKNESSFEDAIADIKKDQQKNAAVSPKEYVIISNCDIGLNLANIVNNIKQLELTPGKVKFIYLKDSTQKHNMGVVVLRGNDAHVRIGDYSDCVIKTISFDPDYATNSTSSGNKE